MQDMKSAVTNAEIMFWYIRHKMLHTHIWNYKKKKNQVNEKLKPPIGVSKSLLISESLNQII